jgi:hypothetical protein
MPRLINRQRYPITFALRLPDEMGEMRPSLLTVPPGDEGIEVPEATLSALQEESTGAAYLTQIIVMPDLPTPEPAPEPAPQVTIFAPDVVPGLAEGPALEPVRVARRKR